MTGQRSMVLIFGAALVGALLAGCGGGSTSEPSAPEIPPGGGAPPPAPIVGVATPSSVAVVTATNAN